MATARRHVADLTGVTAKLTRPVLFSFRTPIEVEVRGFDLRELRRLSQAVEARMQAIPGLSDVRSTLQRGNPEVQIAYDRGLLARYNLNVRSVADLVQNKVLGHTATEFRQSERSIDVVVRLREEDRGTLEIRGI